MGVKTHTFGVISAVESRNVFLGQAISIRVHVQNTVIRTQTLWPCPRVLAPALPMTGSGNLSSNNLYEPPFAHLRKRNSSTGLIDSGGGLHDLIFAND